MKETMPEALQRRSPLSFYVRDIVVINGCATVFVFSVQYNYYT